MSLKLSDIIAALPTLTPKELAVVWAAVDRLADAQQNISDATMPLYDAVCAVLSVRVPYRDFSTSNVAKAWRRHAPSVIGYIESTWPQVQRSRVQKAALMQFLIELLRDDLKERKIPISLGVIVNNLGAVPEVFEKAFPSYRSSGLAHLVLDQMQRNQKGRKKDGQHHTATRSKRMEDPA